eukprot:7007244-Pyramimonas_sp.AAC.1
MALAAGVTKKCDVNPGPLLTARARLVFSTARAPVEVGHPPDILMRRPRMPNIFRTPLRQILRRKSARARPSCRVSERRLSPEEPPQGCDC